MSDAAGRAAPAALAGLEVIDLTRVLAGPLCAMLLGDLGADVIKVEPPAGGDDTRGWGPPWFGAGEERESAYFVGANRNKRSIALDLAQPAGRELLGRLMRRADVVLDNYKLGTLDRWGFDDAWFEREAPRAVRASITGYGSSGPYAPLPGYDFIAQAESGLMSICGAPDGEPTKYGVAIVDLVTGLLACNGVLAALEARHRTGRGQKVEASLFESGLFLLANVAMNHLATGRDAGRYGNGHPNIVPYTTYPTADGRIALAVGNDGQFAKLALVLGHPEWSSDARYAKNAERVAHRAAVDAMVGAALAARPAADWIDALRAAGIPCGRINSVAQALADPQTAAREMVLGMVHPRYGAVRMPGFPVKLSDTPARARRAPPRLGEHAAQVLAEKLGLDAAEVEALHAQGVVRGD